jgi:phospholipid/cholesterol/gamma-HCH transport system substrate-binding protein
VIEANQSGLVGETSINITPLEALPTGQDIAGPLDSNCDPDIIICNGSQLQGEAQLDVNELIRSTLRIANLLSDPQFTANINSVAQNASDALAAISSLSGDVSNLTNEVEQLVAGGTVESTLTSVSQAADEIRVLAATNRTTLSNTLLSFQQSSDRLRGTLDELAPVINQDNLAEIIQNLETLSSNAAEASANLRDFSTGINDPANALMLQQLLDSARSTFQNIQKITSDLDELTGDPAFRTNIRDLIDGLNRLISTSERLEQQAQVAQALNSLSTVIQPPSSNADASDSSSHSPSDFPSRSVSHSTPDRHPVAELLPAAPPEAIAEQTEPSHPMPNVAPRPISNPTPRDSASPAGTGSPSTSGIEHSTEQQ